VFLLFLFPLFSFSFFFSGVEFVVLVVVVVVTPAKVLKVVASAKLFSSGCGVYCTDLVALCSLGTADCGGEIRWRWLLFQRRYWWWFVAPAIGLVVLELRWWLWVEVMRSDGVVAVRCADVLDLSVCG
jgi:hypothetical protein